VLGKILSSHCKNRDDIIWLSNLRGEDVLEDVSLNGICELNISNNAIDSQCIKDICKFLYFDQWTKSINLRYNAISEEGIKELIGLLKNNFTLISLDLRDNPGLNEALNQQIYKKLIKNINLYKKYRNRQKRRLDIASQNQNSAAIPAGS